MEGLPTRWLTREVAGVRQFMNAGNQIFPTFSDAYDYLYKNKEKFDNHQMITFYSTFSKYSFQTAVKETNSKPSSHASSTAALTPSVIQKQGKNNKPSHGNKGRPRNNKNDNAFMKLKAVIDAKGSEESVERAVAILKTFGWYCDPKLPEGWLKFNPIRQPVQYLVFKPFCMKFPSKAAAVAELKRRLAAKEVSREYVVRFTVGDSSAELQLAGAALLGAEEDGDWEEGHESVPRGWKIRRSSKNKNQYEILSKENICFKSRLAALQFMNHDFSSGIFEHIELLELREKLKYEGWDEQESLPAGWKINRTKTNSMFLTRAAQLLEDTNSVMSHVMDSSNKITSTERKNIMNNISKLFFNATPSKVPPLTLKSDLKIKKQRHPKLPKNWTFENLSEKVIKITAASGEVFYSRLQALEFMIESEQDQDIIFDLWETLEDEDWIFGCNYVPVGWGVRKQDTNVLFLTKELVVLTSVDEALDYIENDDEYEPKDYKILNDWKEIYIGATWIEDSLLPKGWRKTELRIESEEEESQTEHFLAPNTDIYNGRVALIQQLVREGEVAAGDIVRLWSTLDTESWMLDTTQVPIGWKIRFDCELNQDEFLAPDMRVFTSRQSVLDLVAGATLPGEKMMAEHIMKWSQLSLA